MAERVGIVPNLALFRFTFYAKTLIIQAYSDLRGVYSNGPFVDTFADTCGRTFAEATRSTGSIPSSN